MANITGSIRNRDSYESDLNQTDTTLLRPDKKARIPAKTSEVASQVISSNVQKNSVETTTKPALFQKLKELQKKDPLTFPKPIRMPNSSNGRLHQAGNRPQVVRPKPARHSLIKGMNRIRTGASFPCDKEVKAIQLKRILSSKKKMSPKEIYECIQIYASSQKDYVEGMSRDRKVVFELNRIIEALDKPFFRDNHVGLPENASEKEKLSYVLSKLCPGEHYSPLGKLEGIRSLHDLVSVYKKMEDVSLVNFTVRLLDDYAHHQFDCIREEDFITWLGTNSSRASWIVKKEKASEIAEQIRAALKKLDPFTNQTFLQRVISFNEPFDAFETFYLEEGEASRVLEVDSSQEELIPILPSAIFKWMPNLESAILQDFHIAVVPFHTFSGCSQLKEVNLDFNTPFYGNYPLYIGKDVTETVHLRVVVT